MKGKYLILPINVYDDFTREYAYTAPAIAMIELTPERLNQLRSCAKLVEKTAAKDFTLEQMDFMDDKVLYVEGDPGEYDFGAFLEGSRKMMSEQEERAYDSGSRMAWGLMLGECLKNLGYDNPEAMKAGWVSEREAAISILRALCSEFGDNDWENDLHLADIIEKHLGRHLWAKEPCQCDDGPGPCGA